MQRFAAVLLSVVAIALAHPAAQQGPAATAKPLDIYVVDTEGGKATLFVSPTGQTVLIDSGNPGSRDTDRLMEVIAAAGVKQIDYLVTTHYHVDHVGGMQELAKRIPIGTYVDHGPSVETREQVAGFQAAYAELYGKAKHLVVKPGDKVPVTGLDWRIVTSAGEVLKTPLPGAGKPNPLCASFTPKDITTDPENAQSVGSLITLGQFRAIDLGDLLWNKEYELMCPNNPIGTVDLYLVTHHGTDPSGSPQIVHALQPRVALMQNGTRKGAGVQAMPTMRSSPGLEDIWQLHWSYTAGIEQNSAGVFVANVDDNQTIATQLTAPPRGGGPGRGAGPTPGATPPPPGTTPGPPGSTPPFGAMPPGAQPQVPTAPPGAVPPGAMAPPGAPPAGATPPPGMMPPPPQGAPPGAAPQGGGGGRGGGGAAPHSPAYWIKVSAKADGSFTVTNSRNNFSKTYPKRAQAR